MNTPQQFEKKPILIKKLLGGYLIMNTNHEKPIISVVVIKNSIGKDN